MKPRQTRAGTSALRRYQDLRKEWLRRNRRIFGTVFGVLLGFALLFNGVFLLVLPHPYVAGVFTGMAVATFVGVRQCTPDWIDNWMTGAEGEKRTQRRLESLPPEWTVEHDIDTGQGNIDHLVIGPGGIFVLDSKFWAGSVSTQGDRAIIDRWGRHKPWIWDNTAGLKRHARETAERVRARTRIVQWVQPVIVVWAEFGDGTQGDTCTFVAGDQLVEWLLTQPTRIHESVLPRITAAVTSAWTPAAE